MKCIVIDTVGKGSFAGLLEINPTHRGIAENDTNKQKGEKETKAHL